MYSVCIGYRITVQIVSDTASSGDTNRTSAGISPKTGLGYQQGVFAVTILFRQTSGIGKLWVFVEEICVKLFYFFKYQRRSAERAREDERRVCLFIFSPTPPPLSSCVCISQISSAFYCVHAGTRALNLENTEGPWKDDYIGTPRHQRLS